MATALNCKDKDCINVSKERIFSTMSSIDTFLFKDSEKLHQRMFWGYSCQLKDKDLLKSLLDKSKVLQRYLSQIRNGLNPCLCEVSVARIIETVSNTVGSIKYTKTYKVDESNLEDWTKDNPNCVAYEDWEKAIKKTCNLPQVEITSTHEDIFLFAYDVKTTNEDIIWQVFDILTEVKEFKLEYDLDSTSEDYNLLPEYGYNSELVECGINFEIISKLRECNIDVSYNSEKKCPVLTYETGATLTLCSMEFENISADTLCELKNTIHNG